MKDRTKTFELKDSEGNVHEYDCRPFPASQSMDLAVQILALLSRPGVALIGQLVDQQGAENVDLTKVDLGDLAGNLEGALSSIATKPEMLRRLLGRTRRDNRPLSNDDVFDDSFTGNWGELYLALKEVIVANGFIDFLSFMAKSKDGGEV